MYKAKDCFDKWFYTTTKKGPYDVDFPVSTVLIYTQDDNKKLEILEEAFMAGYAAGLKDGKDE